MTEPPSAGRRPSVEPVVTPAAVGLDKLDRRPGAPVETPPRRRARPRSTDRPRLAIPPQHGAWAYLALPLLLGLVISGWTWLGGLFALTWVLAYPVSYYGSRALTTRIRRGSWSRIAIRERANAVPWAVAAGVGALVLVAARPWLLAVGVVLTGLWWVGMRLALAGRERGIGNDLLLVGQSLVALPLVWAITEPLPIPAAIWWATLVCAVYFVGSVIHVKSLIREADDRRWRVADVGFHVAALAMGLLSPWLLVPFAGALVRSLALRPGAKPGVIGAVETVESVLVAVFTLVAVGG